MIHWEPVGQVEEKRAVSQDLELWISRQLIEDGFTLVTSFIILVISYFHDYYDWHYLTSVLKAAARNSEPERPVLRKLIEADCWHRVLLIAALHSRNVINV